MPAVNTSTELRNAIQAVNGVDPVITLNGSDPDQYSVLTLAKRSSFVPAASPYNGYTIQGTSSNLTNSAKIVDTRIYQQNVDGAFAPGVVKDLTLKYTLGGAADNGSLLSVTSTAARTIALNNVLITGVHQGWNGNGNLYMSLRSFNAAAPLSTSLTLTGVTVNLTGQAGFDGTNGGSAFLHSWNNNGPVTISGSTFDEAGYASSFNFLAFGATAAGNYTLTNNTFKRTSNATVRPEGNRLGSVVANLTNNTFQDGSYLDLYGNVGSVTLNANTFATIAGGYGIRVNEPVTGAAPTLSGTNVFTGPGLPLKYVNATANTSYTLTGAVTVNGKPFSNLIAGGQGADTLIGTTGNDHISGDSGADSIVGGLGNDYLDGGADDDILTGGNGQDRFQWFVGQGTDDITDFVSGTGNDFIVLRDTFPNTTAPAPLSGTDYTARANLSAIQATDSNKVVRVNAGDTTTSIASFTKASFTNAYVLVLNSTTGFGQLYYDADWGDTAGRELAFNITNITTQGALNSITSTRFEVI